MGKHKANRRKFLQEVTKASGIMMLSPLAGEFKFMESAPRAVEPVIAPGKIKFAVININHPHIYGMTSAIKRGGGELVAWEYGIG